MDSIYLDHAATTPLDPDVLEAMMPHLQSAYGNASSVHQMGRQARFAVEESRETVAACFGAEPAEIIFTSGGTESDNYAIKGALAARESEGRTGLITSAAEHEAVLRPAERLQAEQVKEERRVRILTPQSNGAVTPDQLASELSAVGAESVALVSLMHANNEIGTMTRIAEIAEVCHEHGVWLHCDAVQTAGLLGVNVHELGVDLMSVSSHKFYGPKGTGCLYVRGGIDLGPLVEGGSQERDRRGGTENVAGVVGMAYALKRATEAAAERVEHVRTLQQRLIEGIEAEVKGPVLFNTPVETPEATAPHIVNISFPPQNDTAVDGEMLILNLDMKGVMVSAGSACTSGAMEPSHVLSAIGRDRATASAAVRFSLGVSNTEEHVDKAVDALASTISRMRRR